METGGAGMRELLTAEELSRRLKVSPETVRKWGRQAKIPVIRISPKVLRFDIEAVEAVLVEPSAGRA
jgi:predicted site-specific integrase-resolvase